MKIGTFTKTEDGIFEGRIATLNLEADVRFLPIVDKTNEKMPDYRITRENTEAEAGAGWNEVSRNNKPYIQVKIDDPSFAAPMWAALTRDDNGEYTLYWDRPKPSRSETAASEGPTL